jgi:type I restriction enzyme S subunit
VVESASESLPNIQLEHVESGTGRLVTSLDSGDPNGSNKFLPGDVLFSKLRPYLAKSLLVTEPLQGSSEFLCLRPAATTEARYLTYLTRSRPWLDHAVLTSYGTKMPRTSWEQMADLRIPLPQLEEQRRIADFLDDQVARIDRIIAHRGRQSSLVECAFWSDCDEALRDLPRVPVRRLVREIVVGIVIQPSKLYSDDEDGVPALRGMNVRAGFISTSDLVKITPGGHADNPRSTLKRGDVVVVRTGDAGASSVVPPEADGWNCIDILVARPSDALSSGFLEIVLNASRKSADVAAASSGSIQQHFGVDALAGLPVPFASASVQAEVVDRVQRARASRDSAQQALRRSIALLTEYKHSLITAAVTGELDVTTASSGIPG